MSKQFLYSVSRSWEVGSSRRGQFRCFVGTLFVFAPTFVCASLGDFSLSEPAFDSQIVLKTSARFAGAISSVIFRGKEYIDNRGPGALLQSASSFDSLGECYNPTEAGSWMGDPTPNTSVLKAAEVTGNQLRTVTDMGFWRNPGNTYPRGCGLRPEYKQVVNTAHTSGHLLYKWLTVGLPDFPNVIEYRVAYHVPAPATFLAGAIHDSTHFETAVFEASTGYLLKEFSSAVYYDPINGTEIDAGNRRGEQSLPVILFTPDKHNAMGVYSPQLPQRGLRFGYGRFASPDINKWNCVFREKNVTPGVYEYQCLIIIGTLDEVEATMRRLGKAYTHSSSPVPLRGSSSMK